MISPCLSTAYLKKESNDEVKGALLDTLAHWAALLPQIPLDVTNASSFLSVRVFVWLILISLNSFEHWLARACACVCARRC